MKLNYALFSILMIIITALFFFLFVNPSVDSFTYWGFQDLFIILEKNEIPMETPAPLFYILEFQTMVISNLLYEDIVTAPFNLFLIIFPLIAFFNIVSRKIWFSVLLTVAFLTYSTHPSVFSFTTYHSPAIILLISVLICVLIIIKKPSVSESYLPFVVIIFIMIISINLYSYKYMLFIVMFLFSIWILKKFSSITGRKWSPNFLIIGAVGLIVSLAFNKAFFNSFLPIIAGNEISPSTGIDKILLSLGLINKTDPLSNFYYSYPDPLITNLKTLWMLIIAIIIVVIIGYAIYELCIQRKKLTKPFLYAMVISSSATLIIYSFIGHATFTYFIITGLLAVSVVTGFTFKKKEAGLKIGTIVCIILISLNFLTSTIININNSSEGNRDIDNFEYLDNYYNWHQTHFNNASYLDVSTDVFTLGYFKKEFVKGSDYDPNENRLMTRDDISNIVGLDDNNSKFVNNYYILNMETNYNAIWGWEIFNPWHKYSEEITVNKNLDLIYSSGSVQLIYQT